jgi:hypothetical protein
VVTIDIGARIGSLIGRVGASFSIQETLQFLSGEARGLTIPERRQPGELFKISVK